MSRWILIAALCVPGFALAQDVAPLDSHVVTSRRRSLTAFPYKGIISSEKGWKRVTASLVGRPEMPAFDKGQVCLLVVADTAGGSTSRVTKLAVHGEDAIEVVLARDEAPRPANNPSYCAFFYRLSRDYPGGVHLLHKTQLAGGGGAIQRAFPPLPSDHEERVLPRLGPDLRFKIETSDGSPVPDDLQLRYEASFPGPRGAPRRPGRVETVPFPHEGLPFPRIRDGVHHVYAAFAKGWRSKNPLAMDRLPRNDADGSPLPVKHRFVLEPVRE